jgi:formylglycine-generating enzyme
MRAIAQGGSAHAGEVAWFPAGPSWVGTDAPVIPGDGEGPQRRVRLARFGIERFAVTNDRFAEFVSAAGYTTDAERFGWSFVFHSFLDPELPAEAFAAAPWWRKIEGACWHAPEGRGSTVSTRGNHPVLHVSWNDATAFAAWCGGRLPSEAEWEHAARGGTVDRRFPWGNEEPTDQLVFCNIWQGRFPIHNTIADGYLGTAPVNSYAPNACGLYNMCGNTWEWCSDPHHLGSPVAEATCCGTTSTVASERTVKGGSYLCHPSYCYRYRIAARSGRSPDTSAGHLGFRIAYD